MIRFNIIDSARQSFSTIINKKRIVIELNYNPSNDRWSFNLYINDELSLHGRKIVPGCDLIGSFDFDIGHLVCFSEKKHNPGRDELPSGKVNLYHLTEDEFNGTVAS